MDGELLTKKFRSADYGREIEVKVFVFQVNVHSKVSEGADAVKPWLDERIFRLRIKHGGPQSSH